MDLDRSMTSSSSSPPATRRRACPGKALLDIAGKPMVVHVAERAQRSGAGEVWVATDDERVLKAVDAARTSGA